MSNLNRSSLTKSLKLPPHEMPEDWEDDPRMDFLYSAFKDRSDNPISWDAKMDFWKTYIQKYCVCNNLVCFNELKIKSAFERKAKLPACILPVLEALKREGKVLTVAEMNKHGYRGQSWASWTTENIVAKPASFALGKLWTALGYEHEPRKVETVDMLICVEALQKKAEDILKKHSADPDCQHSNSPVLELSTFLREEGEEDARLALIWLCKEKKAVVDDKFEPNLVKIGYQATITNVDRQTLALKKQEAALTRKLTTLDTERELCIVEARDYLSKNMRTAAKSSLRKKKEIERRIEKLADTIANVHVLLSHVEDTDSNAKVIESYKSATAALKATFKQAGLSEDGAAVAMDELEEALDMNEDMKTLISQPMSPGGVTVDDSELESELAELLADDAASGGGGGGTSEQDIDIAGLLPEVPKSPISASILTQNTHLT